MSNNYKEPREIPDLSPLPEGTAKVKNLIPPPFNCVVTDDAINVGRLVMKGWSNEQIHIATTASVKDIAHVRGVITQWQNSAEWERKRRLDIATRRLGDSNGDPRWV